MKLKMFDMDRDLNPEPHAKQTETVTIVPHETPILWKVNYHI